MGRVFGHLVVAALAMVLLCFGSNSAFADVRVALVIGNGAYRSVPALDNPVNDANDVAAALKRLGFDTILATDQDKAGMEEAEIRFARAARAADVAMFYYSGHALQFGGVNYLAPVDVKLRDEADLRRMVRVDELVSDLQEAKNLRILVLDSCRDNPLADELKRSIGATRAMSLQRGLAKMDTPEGMIIAYSTQAGRVAYDGEDKNARNSPYTRAFLKDIEAQDEIGSIFRQVSADVYDATHQQQFPELSLSIIGKFYLHGTPQLASKPEETAPRDFEAAKSLDTVGGWDAFLKQHPDGFYASLAKEWRAKAQAKLAAASAASTTPTSPPKPEAVVAATENKPVPSYQKDDRVLAKVNGEEIRDSDVTLAVEELGPKLAQMDPAVRRENVLAFLIDMHVVAKIAEAKKLQESDVFKAALASDTAHLPDDGTKTRRYAFHYNRLLMDSLLASEGKAATTDEAMKKVYDDAAKQVSGEQEVHARHILVVTEAEAREVKAELDKGADFAELAKKKSRDPGAADGGDLGFFTKDQMVPEFSAVAFSLEPGKISDPVKSQFGWHIIKVEEKRNRKPPDFDQVKGQIETYVTRKAQADYVAKLRGAAKIERFDLAARK